MCRIKKVRMLNSINNIISSAFNFTHLNMLIHAWSISDIRMGIRHVNSEAMTVSGSRG